MKLIRKLGTRLSKTGRKQSWAVYECPDCLQEVEKLLGNGEKQISCGCERKKGDSYTRLHVIWTDIKQRCTNPNAENYPNYGGKGITVCIEWSNSFKIFKYWALNNGYADNLQIDRKVDICGYYPKNCQWLTPKENVRKRKNTILTMVMADEIRYLYKTGKYTQKELAIKFNVSTITINNVISNKTWKN